MQRTGRFPECWKHLKCTERNVFRQMTAISECLLFTDLRLYSEIRWIMNSENTLGHFFNVPLITEIDETDNKAYQYSAIKISGH